jgi:hypothetical protein
LKKKRIELISPIPMFLFPAKFIQTNLLTFSAITSCYFTTKNVKMPSAVVVLPPGAEEIEFVGSVDILRRAGV